MHCPALAARDNVRGSYFPLRLYAGAQLTLNSSNLWGKRGLECTSLQMLPFFSECIWGLPAAKAGRKEAVMQSTKSRTGEQVCTKADRSLGADLLLFMATQRRESEGGALLRSVFICRPKYLRIADMG